MISIRNFWNTQLVNRNVTHPIEIGFSCREDNILTILNSYDSGYFITFVQLEYTLIWGEVRREIVKQISSRFESLKSKLYDKATIDAWSPYKGSAQEF